MRRVLIVALLAVSAMAYAETGPPKTQASDPACRTWQWVNPRPESRELESVVSGDPGVVAVGDYGTILFSPEGISWRAVNSGTTAFLHDVVWTGQAFFAVGDGGTVVTSANGLSWVSLVTDTDLDMSRVAFGAGVLVAVGPDATLLTSSDGAAWVVTDLVWSQTDDVVWTGTQFVVVGPFIAAISADGLQWQSDYVFGYDSCSLPMSMTWTGSETVAVYPCYGTIFSSTDGLDWTRTHDAYEPPYAMNIAWFDGIFVAWDGDMWIATEPSSWMRVSASLGSWVNSIAWTGRRFVTVGDSSGIMTSRTGTDWSVAQIAEGAQGHFTGLAEGNGILVAVGWGDEGVSSDGFEWSPVPEVKYFRDVAFGNGRFVAVSNQWSGVTLDGVTWSLHDTGVWGLYAVEWVGDRFLALRRSNGTIIGSTDGESWNVEHQGTASEDQMYGLGAGGGGAVAVGYDYLSETALVLIERSPGTWEKALPFLDTDVEGSLRDIAFGAGRWVAVGTYGKVVTSTDLDTWLVVDSGVTDSLYSISWNGSEFLAAGSDGIVISSPDGLSWVRETTPTNLALNGTEWFDGAWYVAGSGGTVLRGSCTWPPDPPVAAFTVEPAAPAPGEVVRFTDVTSGFATSYSWLFGGGYSTAANPAHVYSAPGSYGVTQTVCNPAGCDQANTQVNVAERPPQAAFVWRFPVLMANEPAKWIDLSSGPPGSWTWVFGDGAVSPEQEPVHTYAEPGIYTTLLMVSNGSGSDRAEEQVVVGPAPIVTTSGGGWYEDIVWNGSQWLAVRNAGVAISGSGVEWTEHTIEEMSYPGGIVWTGAEYVAVGGYGMIAVSGDGLIWSFTDVGGGFTDVATCDGTTVVVGGDGKVLVSSDLVSWQDGSSGTTDDIRRVACEDGLFVATANGSPAIIESTDGLSWTPATTEVGSFAKALVWGDGHFYADAGTNDGGVLMRHPDGTWAPVDDGMYSPSYLTDLATVNGRLLASGDDSLWWLSPELSSWVPIEGSGDGRMAVADDTVMILNRRSIHRLAVQPQRLLVDGFESGDLSAWSVAIQ